MAYRINGELIKAPPGGVPIEKYRLTKSARTADGNMNMELIARKRKFQFNYEVIESKDMLKIEKLLFDTEESFVELSYDEDGKSRKATVYVGAIQKTPAWTDGYVQRWTNVTFSLIER